MATPASLRVTGVLGRSRIRLGGLVLRSGAHIHAAFADLAFAIEPRLFDEARPRGFRPWLGALVVTVLICGCLFIGIGAVWTIHAALPAREAQP